MGEEGAKTFILMTFSITTLSMTTFSIAILILTILSIKTVSIMTLKAYAGCRYEECHLCRALHSFILILSVVMLRVLCCIVLSMLIYKKF